MKCERVLSALATGGAFARWQARRHAAACPRCARDQRLLEDISRELAAAQPLTAAQRALWTAAGTEAIASRPRWAWVYPVGLAAATVLLGAIGLKLWLFRPVGREHGLPVVQLAVEPSEASPAHPFGRAELASEMLAKVDRLDHELAELRHEAELLDARKDADALWARYAPRKQSAL